jgi:hypothetical protein
VVAIPPISANKPLSTTRAMSESEVTTRFKSEVVDGRKHARRVRSFGCCIPGCRKTPIHTHHVKSVGAGGQPDDLIPLCVFHHTEGHQIGWKTFERRYCIGLTDQAEYYAAVSRTLGLLPK